MSSVATSSSEASDTLSADGYPKRTPSSSRSTGPSGTGTAPGASSMSGFRSSTSKTRSKLTSAAMISIRALANAVSGVYSLVSSSDSATTAPASSRPTSAYQPPSP
ncbi:Uncharacterised protein [Mycobacteroides abscessus subsp. abscessus]|nr:Uncharacterised protein [Mycobacteroides abscessus subsp. abscessus]